MQKWVSDVTYLSFSLFWVIKGAGFDLFSWEMVGVQAPQAAGSVLSVVSRQAPSLFSMLRQRGGETIGVFCSRASPVPELVKADDDCR